MTAQEQQPGTSAEPSAAEEPAVREPSAGGPSAGGPSADGSSAEDDELAALEAEAAALEARASRRGGLSGARRTLLLQAPLIALLALALILWGRGGGSPDTAGAAPPRLAMHEAHLDPPAKPAGPVNAYLDVVNGGPTADRLLSVSTPWAATVTLVDSAGKPLPWLTVPASGSLTLAPGGTHLELTQLRRTPKLHDTIQLDLTFASSGTVHVWAPVGPASSLTVEDVMHAMNWMDRLPPAGA